MTISVNDYLNGSVDIIETDLSNAQTEIVEAFLQKIGYNLSCIAWMADVKNIAFRNMKNQ